MAVTIVKRPECLTVDITTTFAIATITDSGASLFTTSLAHGLVDGDYIYFAGGNEPSYLYGFWYVDQVTTTTFLLREYDTASTLAFFKNEANLTYYKTVKNNWSPVHQPIVYKIKSDVWPTNTVDLDRYVSSVANYNGYTYITVSGDIKTSGNASALEQILLTGTNVDGYYKILYWFNDSNIVIDLPFSTSNNFGGGLAAVKYDYFNYYVRVRVFAGLATTHFWYLKKPIAQVVELKLVPDSTGVVTVDISKYIKSKINIDANDGALYSMPNNLNAWTNFYITVAESYSDSNGYTVSDFTSSYTDDSGTFTGFAINAKLPFKTNVYSDYNNTGFGQYVSGVTSTTTQSWLTNFKRPVIHGNGDGTYFGWDISFIKNTTASGDYIKEDRYRIVNGSRVLILSKTNTITDYDQGVYRFSPDLVGVSSELKEIDLTLYNASNTRLSVTITCDVDQKCFLPGDYINKVVWLNSLGGFDHWVFKARKEYGIQTEAKETEINIFNNYPLSYGRFAQGTKKQTLRKAKKTIILNSQFVTASQEEAISLLQSSLSVQIGQTGLYNDTTMQTIIIESGSLMVRKDGDKTRTISFNASFAHDLPTQEL